MKDENKSKSVLLEELEEARELAKEPPEWGNCKRGCTPAYLNREGFCSPACVLGAPRGEFVTTDDVAVTVDIKPVRTLRDGYWNQAR